MNDEEYKSINIYLNISADNIIIEEDDRISIKVNFPDSFAKAVGYTSAETDIFPKKISRDQSLQIPVRTYLIPMSIYEDLELPQTLKLSVYLNDQLFDEEVLDIITQK